MSSSGQRYRKYIDIVLDNACSNIRLAPNGASNNTLNAQAFAIGQFVGAGALTYSEAERILAGAAIGRGIVETEAMPTITSGLRAGMKNPRDIDQIGQIATKHELSVNPEETTPKSYADIKKTKTDYARRLYKDSVPLTGTIAEVYLRESRKLKGEMPKTLRCHPGIFHTGFNMQFPALLAPIIRTDATSTIPSAAHITSIDPNTKRKILSPDAKKMIGSCKGGAIWLGEYAANMLITEGIEKTLACIHASGLPGASGLSSTLMPSVIWPRGTRKVTICADTNPAGEIGVNRAASCWSSQDIEVSICYPPILGLDWDECEKEAIRDAIAGAKLWLKPVLNHKRSREERDKIIADMEFGKMPPFERDLNGNVRPNEFNTILATAAMGLAFSFNEFSQEAFVTGLTGYGPRLTDAAFDEILLALEREFDIKLQLAQMRRIIRSEARRKGFHPVRTYLDNLEWDGIDRIDEWLAAYGGAENTPFTQAVSRIMLIAAVRRVRQPGCKFDEMVVLEGIEGKNKSTALRIMAGDSNFSDDLPLDAQRPRDVIERLRGFWIIECSDLKGVKRTDVEHLKAFMSRQTDSDSLKFEVETSHYPRQCIFVGTTNESNYLLSMSGNRRFWPVPVVQFDIEALRQGRDQLWAEAACREAQGEIIRLPEGLWPEARARQTAREETDEWDGLVADFLAAELADRRNEFIPVRTTILDVATNVLNIKTDRIDSRVEKRIGRAMRRAGWHMTSRSSGKRFWTPLPVDERKQQIQQEMEREEREEGEENDDNSL